jgi:hypothetical protein
VLSDIIGSDPARRRRRRLVVGRPGKTCVQPRIRRFASSPGSKAAKVLDLLKRPGGASLKELMKTTGWQPHSVRGFLSGTIGKRMGLPLTSTKGEGEERTYSLKS